MLNIVILRELYHMKDWFILLNVRLLYSLSLCSSDIVYMGILRQLAGIGFHLLPYEFQGLNSGLVASAYSSSIDFHLLSLKEKSKLITSLIIQNFEIQVTVECSDIKETPVSPLLRFKKHHRKDNVKIVRIPGEVEVL